MTLHKLLIANRGEVALRIMATAREMGLSCYGVYGSDDADCLHVRHADSARELVGRGAAAYLDAEQMLLAATELGCDAIHPGYGFLSENADFARRCEQAGMVFVGPAAATLALLGDKLRARAFAKEANVPVLEGMADACTLQSALSFFDRLGGDAAVVLKAVAGGGGRGMRVVHARGDLEAAFSQCEREAHAAFGSGALYVEQYVTHARHIEVQVIGDGTGAAVHAFERECSVQRRHQKLIEIAPAPRLEAGLRAQILDAAVTLGRQCQYRGLCTMEFLVDAATSRFWFIEANPRLQVEHTVTEEVTGLDLVHVQLAIAGGATLTDLNLAQQQSIPQPQGYSIQLRVNAEAIGEGGAIVPQQGTLTRFERPVGPGVRVDSHGYVGYAINPHFDSLLAKLIVHGRAASFDDALKRAQTALRNFEIGGTKTNRGLLLALLTEPALSKGAMHTAYVDSHGAQLAKRALELSGDLRDGDAATGASSTQLHASIPIANVPEGQLAVSAPMLGTVVSLQVDVGERIKKGQTLVVLSAMKMEHEVIAPDSGVVQQILVQAGDTTAAGQALIVMEPLEVEEHAVSTQTTLDLNAVRADLAEVIERHAHGLDARRSAAVQKRHKTGLRTARENVADLVDDGTFVEYGALAIAAQRRRRPFQELVERTPADGLVAGIGCVNGAVFGKEHSRCAVMSYDYMVLAGTQGVQNHHKKDRMFELIARQKLPLIFFTEGGGGRPGDTDAVSVSWLDCLAFWYFGKLSGLVPLIGIAAGRCFAGNAALFGCCDVTIGVEGASIGMGGPAMIEGGGLGVYRPDEVGPVDVQTASGVIDIRVQDEAEAVAVAKKYLSYFQGRVTDYSCDDQRKLRWLIPENRMRIYDVRAVIETLVDTDSVLELRKSFGHGMVTAFARVEGRPLGIIANNPTHLAGAIDREGADKAARFMQLCDAFDIPILFLCDTPGIMVGPESEKTAMVRHASRMFVTAASLSVPFFTIVLRKGYGLGAQLMAGGSFRAPLFIVGWPTSEFGAMGLEGAVKLGFRKELEAIEDPAQRKETFDKMVEMAYVMGKGVNIATLFEIDDVIDPAQSRAHIIAALDAAPAPVPRHGKKRPCVDTW